MNSPPRDWRDEGRRVLGLYVCGGMGKGKSSLIMNMALWDIAHNRGVCVIDPSADLVKTLIHWIPPRRVKDTIYFDTSDPIPVDLFSYGDSEERGILITQLVNYFNLGTAPVSVLILADLLNTLFDANEAIKRTRDPRPLYSFLDIPKFIKQPKFREDIFQIVPQKRESWLPFPAPSEWMPIVNRLRPFENRPALRKIFAGGGLNVSRIMEERKIFLVNLNDNPDDHFIGSILSAKFQQAAFARRHTPLERRKPYFLYIDECDVVLTVSEQAFRDMLTRVRKFKLCLTMVNVLPSDLPEGIQKKLGAVENYIVFRLQSRKDARFFDEYCGSQTYDGETPILPSISALKKFHALCVMDNEVEEIQTPSPLGWSPQSSAHLIYANSKKLQKRSGDSASRQNQHGMVSLEGNVINLVHDSKNEEVRPSSTPNVPPLPPHRNKAKGPRKPR
jgi:hypothetical protein